MRRKERSAFIRKLRQEQTLNVTSKFQTRETELKTKAIYAEETGEGLMTLGEVMENGIVRPAQTLQEELASAVLWSYLLELDTPVVDGETSLAELLTRIFYRLSADGRMWNPYSRQRSEEWKLKTTSKFFRKCYTLLPGSSEWTLKIEDFVNAGKVILDNSETQDTETPAARAFPRSVQPSAGAVKDFEEESSLPTFSARIAPYAHEN